MEDMPTYTTVRLLGMVLINELSERHIRHSKLIASLGIEVASYRSATHDGLNQNHLNTID